MYRKVNPGKGGGREMVVKTHLRLQCNSWKWSAFRNNSLLLPPPYRPRQPPSQYLLGSLTTPNVFLPSNSSSPSSSTAN